MLHPELSFFAGVCAERVRLLAAEEDGQAKVRQFLHAIFSDLYRQDPPTNYRTNY